MKPPVEAVRHVSFDAHESEIVCLVAPNGAGKTSILKAIAGLVRPTSGSVTIDGQDTTTSPALTRPLMSILLEGDRNLYWRLTARQNLEFFAGLAGVSAPRDRTRIAAALSAVGLSEKADSPARTLSRGQKQRLSIAVVLVRDSSVVLLDEPTLGLDVASSADFRSLLVGLAREKGRTLVVSSHDMELAERVADRVIVLSEGQVVSTGTVQQILDGAQRATRIILRFAPHIAADDVVFLNTTFPQATVVDFEVALALGGPGPTSDVGAILTELGARGYALQGIRSDGDRLGDALLAIRAPGQGDA